MGFLCLRRLDRCCSVSQMPPETTAGGPSWTCMSNPPHPRAWASFKKGHHLITAQPFPSAHLVHVVTTLAYALEVGGGGAGRVGAVANDGYSESRHLPAISEDGYGPIRIFAPRPPPLPNPTLRFEGAVKTLKDQRAKGLEEASSARSQRPMGGSGSGIISREPQRRRVGESHLSGSDTSSV